jgi:hypothetical protein
MYVKLFFYHDWHGVMLHENVLNITSIVSEWFFSFVCQIIKTRSSSILTVMHFTAFELCLLKIGKITNILVSIYYFTQTFILFTKETSHMHLRGWWLTVPELFYWKWEQLVCLWWPPFQVKKNHDSVIVLTNENKLQVKFCLYNAIPKFDEAMSVRNYLHPHNKL